MRSIFRYPGGKIKLSKRILSNYTTTPTTFYEPFVGGGGVMVEAAQKWGNAKLCVTDLNPHVAAFWILMSQGKMQDLCCTLRPLTLEFYAECESYSGTDPLLQSRRFLVVNKGGFNGMINPGTAPIGGWSQFGKWKVDRGWKVDSICKKLMALQGLLHGRLEARCQSIFDCEWLSASDAIYLDPPYVKAGVALYKEFGYFDHERLAQRLKSVPGEWVLSYDDHPVVLNLYKGYSIEPLNVRSSIGRKNSGEVLIKKHIA